MGDSDSTSRALILWQPPPQIIRAAQSTVELAVKLDFPVRVECPLEKLNTKIMLMYLYADRTPVQEARFVLETVPGTPVMAGPLQNGAITLTVPRGPSYHYYFHRDRLADGSLFQFFPRALAQLGPPADPAPPWSSDVAAQGAAKKLRMHWGDFRFHERPGDNAVPVLEKLIHHVITNVMPAPGNDALQIEAAWLIEALILGDGGSPDLWRRLVFNRLGVALDKQSRVLQELLQFLHATTAMPASAVLRVCIEGLNHAGKGNAVDWLRELSGQAAVHEKAVAGHLNKLFAATEAELSRIASASPDQAWAHNTSRTTRWRTSLRGLPGAAQQVGSVLAPAWQALSALVAAHPAHTYHLPGQVERWNLLRQTASPFPPYQPAPVVLPVTWFEIRYLYADGEPVEKAGFVVRDGGDAQIAADRLGPDGIGYVEAAAGRTYKFRFHDDEAEFQMKAPERLAKAEPDGKTWLEETIQGGHIEEGKLVCRWAEDCDVSNLGGFQGNPTFGRLLRLQLIANGLPRRKGETADDEAAEKALVGIIRALLFGDKLEAGEKERLWREASLHRLSAISDPQGVVVERLLALLARRDDLKLPDVVKWLNSSGKGNAYKWLAKLQNDLPNLRKTVAQNLQTVVDGFTAEFGKIANAPELVAQRIGVLNRLAAGCLKKRIEALPKVEPALASAWSGAEGRLKKLVDAKDDLKGFHAVGTLMGLNDYKQAAEPWPARPPLQLPDPGWVELLFIYAGGTPVDKAAYKVTVGAALAGKTTGGYAFEVVDKGKAYKYEFTADEKDFEVLDSKKGKEKKEAFGAGMVDAAIGAGSFKAGKPLLAWGASHYTSDEDFKNAPEVSRIVSAAVRSNSPITVGDADNSHEELTLLLFPLLMGHLLADETGDRLKADEFRAIWDAASFHRLGQVLGPASPVIRDFLYWLHITDNPPHDAALRKLHGIGQGNAHKWLAKLHGQMDDVQKQVGDNLKAICQAIRLEVKKLGDAVDADVVPGSKGLAKDAIARIAKAEANIDAEVVRALKTSRDRLKVLSELNEPVYGGDADICELTICRLQQEKLEPRPAVAAPALDWIELEYLHHDDTPVAGAKYKVVKDDDPAVVLYGGKLADGYAYLIVPHGLKFKFYFHAENAFVLNPAANLNANNLAAIPNLIRAAVLLKKFKKSRLGWGSCSFSDRMGFQQSPSLGQIACHVIRATNVTTHCAANAPEAEELAKLLHPILMRQQANSVNAGVAYKDNTEFWNAAVLNRIGVLLGAEGAVIANLLSAMHAACPRTALGALDLLNILKKTTFLEYLNSLGKGHGVAWLQTLDPLKAANENAVKTNLETIFDRLTTELTELQKQYTPHRKLQSDAALKYSAAVKARIPLVKPDIAVQVARVFTALRDELTAVLNQVRVPGAGKLVKRNTLKQTQAALPARVTPPIPRWAEVSYCYPKLAPVAAAQYQLLKAADAGLVKGGNLDANGFVYVTDLPNDAIDFAFAKDPVAYQPRADAADKPEYKKTKAERTAGAIPVPGYLSYAAPGGFAAVGNFVANTAYNNYNCYYPPVVAPPHTLMPWDPSTPADLAGYRARPTFGKLARNCVARNTQGSRVRPAAASQPEQDEMFQMVQELSWAGNHANNTYWSVAIMNRVGTTGAGALQNNESRVRKAVLLQLLNAPATDLPTLVAMLNSVGKGHAVRWLRALNAARDPLKNAIGAAITQILTDLRAECTNLINRNYPGQGNLGPAVHNNAIGLRNNITNNIITPGLVATKVDLVLNPAFAALNALLANRPLNPRPFARPATAEQLNVFVQPVQPFPLCEPMENTPPAWHLQPTTIQVRYFGIDKPGGRANVTADHHVSVAGAVMDQNGVNGVRNFNVNPAAAHDVRFYFDQDQAAPPSTFHPSYKPWNNPYIGALPNNYLAAAAVANVFLAPVQLPWKGTDVVNQAHFNANPSLGQILARCVIGQMPRVSSANDIQDLTVALMRLIRQPASRAESDEWFRAAVNFAGSKADEGSVIKGILLRVRKHRKMDGAEFLKLFNLASSIDGNACAWLKAQITNVADIGGAQVGLTAILTDFRAALTTLINLPIANPGQQSNANLQNSLTLVMAEAANVQGLINANVPACFVDAKAALAQMRAQDLPLKHIAHLGLNEYKREKADVFLESHQELSGADKEAVDGLTKNRIAAANVAPVPASAAAIALQANNPALPYSDLFRNHPNTPTVWRTLNRYLTGATGGEAKRLAPELAKMSNDEFVEFVENLPPPVPPVPGPAAPGWTRVELNWGGGGGKMGAMVSYQHTDGTLIRYKPGGDEYVNPPTPMYSIEVVDGPNGAQFKVDPNGNAVPWGPGQANNLGGGAVLNNVEKKSRYADNVSKAGHRVLRF